MQQTKISLSFCAAWLDRHSGGTQTVRRAARDSMHDTLRGPDMYLNQLNYQAS